MRFERHTLRRPQKRQLLLDGLEARVMLATDFVVHISVDGLASQHFEPAFLARPSDYPNYRRLFTEGSGTFNARTDVTHTLTLPNHTSMLTGRPVQAPGPEFPHSGHFWTSNSNPPPGATLHNNHPTVDYLSSVFDVVHDAGRSTAMFASKTKFSIFDVSYNDSHGASDEDPRGGDNGRDKIDRTVIDTQTERLVTAFQTELRAQDFAYSFLHLSDPDSVGHGSGWGSAQWLASVQATDRYLGTVFSAVETDPELRGRTAIVLTSDHGGIGFGHNSAEDINNYRIPLVVWGAEFGAGSDLYREHSESTADPGTAYVDYLTQPPPIRNGDSGNLALHLLGLEAIPDSFIASLHPDDPNVTPVDEVLLMDDEFEVRPDSFNNLLDVLANDQGNQLRLERVGPPSQGGRVRVDQAAQTLSYTPPAGFEGTESFTYWARQADQLLTANVVVTVSPENTGGNDGGEEAVRIQLRAVDNDGAPLVNLAVGQPFSLSAWVQDVRAEPAGVESAYIAVEFDPDRVAADGAPVHGAVYSRDTVADVSVGWFDEVGGATAAQHLGGASTLLFESAFQALRPGEALLFAHPSNVVPEETARLLDQAAFVSVSNLGFEHARFNVVEIHNPVNPLDVNGDGFVTPVDALFVINYLNEVGVRSLRGSIPDAWVPTYRVDVTNDGLVTPIDALTVINALPDGGPNRRASVARRVGWTDRPEAALAAAVLDHSTNERDDQRLKRSGFVAERRSQVES